MGAEEAARCRRSGGGASRRRRRMSAATCYPRSVVQCQGHRHYEYAPPQHARPLVAAPARPRRRTPADDHLLCRERKPRPAAAARRPPPAEMLPPAHFYRCVGKCSSFGVVLLLATRLIYGPSRARRLSRAVQVYAAATRRGWSRAVRILC